MQEQLSEFSNNLLSGEIAKYRQAVTRLVDLWNLKPFQKQLLKSFNQTIHLCNLSNEKDAGQIIADVRDWLRTGIVLLSTMVSGFETSLASWRESYPQMAGDLISQVCCMLPL
jgi:hypothetical protein